MEGPDMSPTLSLEESIREFRSNHIRLKQRSPGPSFTITDEERFLNIFILEMLEIFKVTVIPCKLELSSCQDQDTVRDENVRSRSPHPHAGHNRLASRRGSVSTASFMEEERYSAFNVNHKKKFLFPFNI